MKITNWAKTCSFVTVMAVSLVACGSKSENESAESKEYGIQEMSAEEALAAGVTGVMVMVHTDDDGKPISREVRKLPKGVKVGSLSEAEAEAVFANAETVNEDTSADSFYNVGCGGSISNTTVISTTSFNNGCNNNWGGNFNTAWPGVSSNSFSSFQQTTSMTSSSNSFGTGPIFGCSSFSCQNNAVAAWPGFWQNGYATPVRNALFGPGFYRTPVRNFLFGYRPPFVRAWGGGNRHMFGFPTCGSNWNGCW